MSDFWLQEAGAAFEDVLRREREAGGPAARERLGVLRDAYVGLREAMLDRPLAELEPTGRGDAQVARTKGVWVLWMLRQALGPLSFRAVWAGAEGPPGTVEALKAAVAAEISDERQDTKEEPRRTTVEDRLAPSAWDGFFDFWVYSTGLPQYRLLGVSAKGKAGGYTVTLKVANQGTGTIPAPLVVQTEEGARHEFSLAVPGGGTGEVSYSLVTKPVAAAVDPEGDLLQPVPSGEWQVVKIRRWF